MVETAARPAPGAPQTVRRLPRWQPGPKPRRRTELGLLVFGSIITTSLYIIASLGAHSKIPPHVGPFLAVVLGLSLLAHLANRWLVPNANPVLLPLVALLNGIGYVVIARWDPTTFAPRQAAWAIVGILLYVLTLLVVRRSRDLDRYRYLLLLLAGLLLVSPLVPGIGLNILGARLFIHLGPIQFQPIEIAKVLLCIFFASYFAGNKELLSIPTARLGNRLVLDPRPLLPILVGWGLSMVIIGLENDIGFAMLIFTLFIALLWVTTGRIGYLVLGVVLFAVGAFGAAHLFHQVHGRVTVWLDPWGANATLPGAGQLADGWYAMGSGGIGGTGLGRDLAAGSIPYLTSDMVFAAIGDEMGMLGGSVVVIAFVLIVGAGFRIAQTALSDFSRLVATGLTVIIGFQAFFIMAGVTRLLPLTGITLPFVAYGGSSLVANYIVVALLLRISDEGTTASDEYGLLQPGETTLMVARN